MLLPVHREGGAVAGRATRREAPSGLPAKRAAAACCRASAARRRADVDVSARADAGADAAVAAPHASEDPAARSPTGGKKSLPPADDECTAGERAERMLP